MQGFFGRALLVAILSTAALAGCLDADDDGTGPSRSGRSGPFDSDWAARALPYGDDHDHYDAAQHQGLNTPNFVQLGHDPLISPALGQTPSGGLCGDAAVRSDDTEIGVVHAISDEVAFTVVDVTDPTMPTHIGELHAPGLSSRDVAISPDGMYVAIALSTPPTPSIPAVAGAADVASIVPDFAALDSGMTFYRACDGAAVPVPIAGDLATRILTGALEGPLDDAPWGPGIMLVDIADPAAPVIQDWYPLLALGAHSVTAGDVGGRHIISASVVNLATAISNIWFFEIADTPAGQRLVLGGVFQDAQTAGNAPLINGHNDAWMQIHPITGQALAYVANWNQGMVILDISNLALPTVVGRWFDNPGPNADIQSDGTGSVHEAFPMHEERDGRHYTFIGQEILTHPSATPTGWAKVLDTTDPSDPHVVATWTLPEEVVWDESLVWSTHYVDYFEDTLYMANYHAGVWAIDISGLPDDPYPASVGVFVPAGTSPNPPQPAAYSWAPTIMEMNVLSGGDVIIWDSASGVYTARFDATDPAPGKVWQEYPQDSAS